MLKRASSLELLPDVSTPVANQDLKPHLFTDLEGKPEKIADSSFHFKQAPAFDSARALSHYSPDELDVRAANLKEQRCVIDVKLASIGLEPVNDAGGFLPIAREILDHYKARSLDMRDFMCPADRRIQDFIDSYLKGLPLNDAVELPTKTFLCDRNGLARTLSLPIDRDEYTNENIHSYRIKQGILHNPLHDRRTTKGVFHIAEGGLPIPDEKIAVPKRVFGNILAAALKPPADLLEVPYTSTQTATTHRAGCWASTLLRPTVVPGVHNWISEKTMEVRMFAPASLIANIDFVECIFGNAGDPYLPENDAGLDVEHWTGTTGAIILAPHMRRLLKKDIGLPHKEEATERQIRDGMYWSEDDEGDDVYYHGGKPFKLCARTLEGVMVTLIADNYFGYSKKEVKTMLSYSANVYGLAEEEHAGGAICAASYNWGLEFAADTRVERRDVKFLAQLEQYEGFMQYDRALGYATDRNHDEIVYVPEDARLSINTKSVEWTHPETGQPVTVKLLYGKYYVLPCGYTVYLELQRNSTEQKHHWALIGRKADGILCHKPATVSGGGKR